MSTTDNDNTELEIHKQNSKTEFYTSFAEWAIANPVHLSKRVDTVLDEMKQFFADNGIDDEEFHRMMTKENEASQFEGLRNNYVVRPDLHQPGVIGYHPCDYDDDNDDDDDDDDEFHDTVTEALQSEGQRNNYIAGSAESEAKRIWYNPIKCDDDDYNDNKGDSRKLRGRLADGTIDLGLPNIFDSQTQETINRETNPVFAVVAGANGTGIRLVLGREAAAVLTYNNNNNNHRHVILLQPVIEQEEVKTLQQKQMDKLEKLARKQQNKSGNRYRRK